MKAIDKMTLAALRVVRNQGPVAQNLGLCLSLHKLTRTDRIKENIPAVNYAIYLCELLGKWDLNSGSTTFPVPGPYPDNAENQGISPALSFFSAQAHGDLWNRNCLYGRQRWKLVDFCIAELEKLETQDA